MSGKIVNMDNWGNCCWSAAKHGWAVCPVCGERLFASEEKEEDSVVETSVETKTKVKQFVRLTKKTFNEITQKVH